MLLTEREFDPDIHCGVIDLDTKKPCTRSLTCKVGDLLDGTGNSPVSTGVGVHGMAP